MHNHNFDLKQFIIWFSRIEDIPLQTRKDFLFHLKQQGALDEKSITFIQNTLASIQLKSDTRLKQLEAQLYGYKQELERQKNPETSYLNQIYQAAENIINNLVSNFKNALKTQESTNLKNQES